MLVEKDLNNYFQLNWLTEFMIGHKGFICGGCFKNIFNGEKVKDIDVFFKNQTEYAEAVLYFDSMTSEYKGADKRPETYRFHYENSKVKAYRHIESGTVIELCRSIYGTPEEIISNFDFTITKFAIYKEEVVDEDDEMHIETKIVCDDCFFEHLHLKRLVVDEKMLFPASTFERTLRYAKYGYFPCKETKMKIIKGLQSLGDSEIELSRSLYDGMD